jgi:hypothetical protein
MSRARLDPLTQRSRTDWLCSRIQAPRHHHSSILSRSALQGSSFTSVRMLIPAIEALIESWNQKAAPFEWTKHEVHQQDMKRSYADLCN